MGKNPRERSTLSNVLWFSIITKNAKSQLPAVVYATEFLNYDPDEAGNAAPDVENGGGNCPSEPDVVLPMNVVGPVYDTSGCTGIKLCILW